MLKGLSIRKHATSSDSLTLGIFVGHVAEGERQPAAGPAWTASCVSLHRLLCNLTLSSGDRSLILRYDTLRVLLVCSCCF